MSKTDDQIKSEIEDNESRAEWGAWAVVAGLVIEIVLAVGISFDIDKKWLENWGAVIADCLIALGVYSEIHFGRKASRGNTELRRRSEEKVSEANARAADANQKAVEAGLETEKLRGQFAWRLLSEDVIDKLAAALRTKPGSVAIAYAGSDPDSQYFAMQFEKAFKLGNWIVGRHSGIFAEVWFGLIVIVPRPDGESAETTEFIMQAFSGSGIGFNVTLEFPAWTSMTLMGPLLPETAARIYVGPKQPVI